MGDAEMPNAVYERTRTALTGLLPRRAATNVLDRALQRHQRSADEIDGEQMARVLLSGVYRELHGLLPDPGLRRTLRRLARDARGWSQAGRGAAPNEVRTPGPTTPADDADRVAAPMPAAPPSEGSPESSELAVHAHEPDAPAPTAVDALPTAPLPPEPSALEAVPIADVASVAAPRSSHASPPAGRTTGPLAPPARAMAVRRRTATLERVAAALAGLDGVNGVGLFDAAGRPVEVRGSLADAPLLGRMVVAGAALLEAAGPLRSVAVDTARGRLVAVPVRPHWLALTGTADLNLGAVYAALAALEEER